MLKLLVLLARHSIIQGVCDEAVRKSATKSWSRNQRRQTSWSISASGYGSAVCDLVKTTGSQRPKQKRQSKPIRTRRGEPCDWFVLPLLLLLPSLPIWFSLGLHTIHYFENLIFPPQREDRHYCTKFLLVCLKLLMMGLNQLGNTGDLKDSDQWPVPRHNITANKH